MLLIQCGCWPGNLSRGTGLGRCTGTLKRVRDLVVVSAASDPLADLIDLLRVQLATHGHAYAARRILEQLQVQQALVGLAGDHARESAQGTQVTLGRCVHEVAEGREGGTAGIYRPSGELRTGLVDEIEHSIPFESLIWEAPSRESQAWFIRHFGTNVNLGNIPPDEVIPLETLRLGLRSDTLKEVLLGGETAAAG